jgi:hypothetical protein
MKKMQCPLPKIILFLCLLFSFSLTPALSQISNYRLQQADSLFNAKQYTQSLDHYKMIFNQNQFSPAMLMKMAFIEEGLNQIGQAMYYLNLYYLETSDESAIQKMQQLSEKFKLEGYENPDAELALAYYRKFQFYISAALAAIIFFLFTIILYLRRRKGKPLVVFILLVFFSVILFSQFTFSSKKKQGIVASGNTYLMEGPSGAAPVVDVINPGHRLTILNKNDVWIEVEWKGRPAFIKENFLLPVAAL